MKTRNEESIKIAYKKLCEVKLSVSDFEKSGNYGWWINAIERLKNKQRFLILLNYPK